MVAAEGLCTTELETALAAVLTTTTAAGTCQTVVTSRVQAVEAAAGLEVAAEGLCTTELETVLTKTSSSGGGGGGGGGTPTTPFVVPTGPFRGDGPTCSYVGEGL